MRTWLLKPSSVNGDGCGFSRGSPEQAHSSKAPQNKPHRRRRSCRIIVDRPYRPVDQYQKTMNPSTATVAMCAGKRQDRRRSSPTKLAADAAVKKTDMTSSVTRDGMSPDSSGWDPDNRLEISDTTARLNVMDTEVPSRIPTKTVSGRIPWISYTIAC